MYRLQNIVCHDNLTLKIVLILYGVHTGVKPMARNICDVFMVVFVCVSQTFWFHD